MAAGVVIREELGIADAESTLGATNRLVGVGGGGGWQAKAKRVSPRVGRLSGLPRVLMGSSEVVVAVPTAARTAANQGLVVRDARNSGFGGHPRSGRPAAHGDSGDGDAGGDETPRKAGLQRGHFVAQLAG